MFIQLCVWYYIVLVYTFRSAFHAFYNAYVLHFKYQNPIWCLEKFKDSSDSSITPILLLSALPVGDMSWLVYRFVSPHPTYCWWFRNLAPVEVSSLYPSIYKVFYIPGGCLGYLPSTVFSNLIAQDVPNNELSLHCGKNIAFRPGETEWPWRGVVYHRCFPKNVTRF